MPIPEILAYTLQRDQERSIEISLPDLLIETSCGYKLKTTILYDSFEKVEEDWALLPYDATSFTYESATDGEARYIVSQELQFDGSDEWSSLGSSILTITVAYDPNACSFTATTPELIQKKLDLNE